MERCVCPFLNVEIGRKTLVVALSETVEFLIPHLLLLVLCDHTFLNESISIDAVDSAMLIDLLVHHWLCECRLILFVVTVASVADDIDENIALEF